MKRSEIFDEKIMVPSGVGILLAMLIIKYFMEIKGIFAPLVIIAKAIFLPLLLGGVLLLHYGANSTISGKRKVPRWGSILSILGGSCSSYLDFRVNYWSTGNETGQ